MIYSIARAHFRLGFTWLLLDLDLALGILVAIDLAVYLHMGLSLKPAATANLPRFFPIFLPVCAFIILMMFIVPVSLAIAKVAGLPGFARLNTASNPRTVLALHIFACMLFVCCAIFAARLEMVSGWMQDGERFTPEYRSVFLSLVMSPLIVKTIAALVSLAGLGITATFGYLLVGRESTKAVQQYATRANLADLASGLRPFKSPFQSTTTATEAINAIPITNNLTAEMVERYFHKSQLRSERLRYAQELVETSCNLMRELLVARPANGVLVDRLEINGPWIFRDQEGAWEAALRSSQATGNVLIGPFCSPRVSDLIEACCWTTHTTAARIPYKVNDAYSSWKVREENFISELHNRIVIGVDVTVVISHVWYASGFKTPLQSLIRRMRDEFNSTRIHILIDGTNAVGNRCRISIDDGWDAYVFYPHRWLLSRRPCAAVLFRKDIETTGRLMGCLGGDRAHYDDEFHTIAGVRAGLELIRLKGLEYFWQRSEALRDAFIGGLPRSLRTVGSPSGETSTFIVSCYPSSDNVWRRDVHTMDDLIGKICGSASLLVIDTERPWMRIALPYYVDARELNRVNAFLEENVSE